MSTHVIDIQGYENNGEDFIAKLLTVRFTSDLSGETLSISNDENCQFLVPFEKIQPLINEARKNDYTKRFRNPTIN